MSHLPVPKLPTPKLRLINNISFPRELRDAIPDHEPSAQAANTVEWGRRVQLKLRACETGKLSGAFDIAVDMDSDAARALGETILSAVRQSEKMKPVRVWPPETISQTRK